MITTVQLYFHPALIATLAGIGVFIAVKSIIELIP